MSEEFSIRDWAKQGAQGLRSKVRIPQTQILPDAFKAHMRASRKEFLSAFRSLFDAAIDRVDKPRGQVTKIKVE